MRNVRASMVICGATQVRQCTMTGHFFTGSWMADTRTIDSCSLGNRRTIDSGVGVTGSCQPGRGRGEVGFFLCFFFLPVKLFKYLTCKPF